MEMAFAPDRFDGRCVGSLRPDKATLNIWILAGGNMYLKNKKTTALLIALLCISVTLTSASATGGSYSLSAATEDMVVGAGRRCSDFLNGFAIGMGIASFFGCVWCPGVAIASKTVQMLAC